MAKTPREACPSPPLGHTPHSFSVKHMAPGCVQFQSGGLDFQSSFFGTVRVSTNFQSKILHLLKNCIPHPHPPQKKIPQKTHLKIKKTKCNRMVTYSTLIHPCDAYMYTSHCTKYCHFILIF